MTTCASFGAHVLMRPHAQRQTSGAAIQKRRSFALVGGAQKRGQVDAVDDRRSASASTVPVLSRYSRSSFGRWRHWDGAEYRRSCSHSRSTALSQAGS